MDCTEKGNENVQKRRMRLWSRPNGHVAAESTSEDGSTEPVAKIRVGSDYQAVCPEFQPLASRQPDQLADGATQVWSPTVDISEQKLDEYITLAKEKYNYSSTQALAMLFWHKHDMEQAVLDLPSFMPFPKTRSIENGFKKRCSVSQKH